MGKINAQFACRVFISSCRADSGNHAAGIGTDAKQIRTIGRILSNLCRSTINDNRTARCTDLSNGTSTCCVDRIVMIIMRLLRSNQEGNRTSFAADGCNAAGHTNAEFIHVHSAGVEVNGTSSSTNGCNRTVFRHFDAVLAASNIQRTASTTKGRDLTGSTHYNASAAIESQCFSICTNGDNCTFIINKVANGLTGSSEFAAADFFDRSAGLISQKMSVIGTTGIGMKQRQIFDVLDNTIVANRCCGIARCCLTAIGNRTVDKTQSAPVGQKRPTRLSTAVQGLATQIQGDVLTSLDLNGSSQGVVCHNGDIVVGCISSSNCFCHIHVCKDIVAFLRADGGDRSFRTLDIQSITQIFCGCRSLALAVDVVAFQRRNIGNQANLNSFRTSQFRKARAGIYNLHNADFLAGLFYAQRNIAGHTGQCVSDSTNLAICTDHGESTAAFSDGWDISAVQIKCNAGIAVSNNCHNGFSFNLGIIIDTQHRRCLTVGVNDGKCRSITVHHNSVVIPVAITLTVVDTLLQRLHRTHTSHICKAVGGISLQQGTFRAIADTHILVHRVSVIDDHTGTHDCLVGSITAVIHLDRRFGSIDGFLFGILATVGGQQGTIAAQGQGTIHLQLGADSDVLDLRIVTLGTIFTVGKAVQFCCVRRNVVLRSNIRHRTMVRCRIGCICATVKEVIICVIAHIKDIGLIGKSRRCALFDDQLCAGQQCQLILAGYAGTGFHADGHAVVNGQNIFRTVDAGASYKGNLDGVDLRSTALKEIVHSVLGNIIYTEQVAAFLRQQEQTGIRHTALGNERGALILRGAGHRKDRFRIHRCTVSNLHGRFDVLNVILGQNKQQIPVTLTDVIPAVAVAATGPAGQLQQLVDRTAVFHIHKAGTGNIAVGIKCAARLDDQLGLHFAFISNRSSGLLRSQNQFAIAAQNHARHRLTVVLTLAVDIQFSIDVHPLAGLHGQGAVGISDLAFFVGSNPGIAGGLPQIIIGFRSNEAFIIGCVGDHQLHRLRDSQHIRTISVPGIAAGSYDNTMTCSLLSRSSSLIQIAVVVDLCCVIGNKEHRITIHASFCCFKSKVNRYCLQQAGGRVIFCQFIFAASRGQFKPEHTTSRNRSSNIFFDTGRKSSLNKRRYFFIIICLIKFRIRGSCRNVIANHNILLCHKIYCGFVGRKRMSFTRSTHKLAVRCLMGCL